MAAKERFLTVMVPITDDDIAGTYGSIVDLQTAHPASADNVNTIYKVYNGITGNYGYYRVWLHPDFNTYVYHEVVDREFPELGKPLEIFDFTYDATRMGQAPTISAQGIMWYADKDENDNDVTLEGLWSQECHVVFNGENFYLKQIPTSSKSNEDARYKYDIDFVSERVVLENVYLYDVVQPFVTEKPISESAQFSFYGDITELAKRINASLLRSGLATLALRDNQSETEHPRLLADGVTHAADDQFFTYEEWNAIGLGTYSGELSTRDPYIVMSPEGDYIHWHNNIFEHYGGDYNTYLRNEVYRLDENGDMMLSGYQCKIGQDKMGVLTASEEKLITFDNNTIHEALQQFHDTFELQYYISREKDSNGNYTGNTIIWVADCEHDFAEVIGYNADGTPIYIRDSDNIPTTTNPFDYGVEDALLSKEKTNTTDKIITRITGIGSEENIPWYYPNPNADGWIKPVYKRDEVIQQDIHIIYPTSEGSTIADSVRYEKYLKNRIGEIFTFGLLNRVIRANVNAGSRDGFKQSTVLVQNNSAEAKCIINITEANTYIVFDIGALSAIQTTFSVKRNGSSYTPSFSFVNGHGFLPTGRYVITYGFTAEEGHNFIEDTFPIYYFYQGKTWAETGFSTIRGLQHYLQRDGRDRDGSWDWDEYWYNSDGMVNLITPEIGKHYYCYHNNNPENNQIDDYVFPRRGPNNKVVTEASLVGSAEFIENVLYGSISTYKADGWYKKTKKVNLSDYGLSGAPANSACTVFDTIEFQRVKYITPQPYLMPEVYIKTDGERRFYEAHNYYPLQVGTPDSAIGEKIADGTSDKIINPLYKPEESAPENEHYNFENEFILGRPKEHIESFDDVKPTIKGQTMSLYLDGATRQLRIDVVDEFAYDETDNDEVWETGESESGEYKHPYFFAKLRPLGFNIFDLALQEDMVLSMTTGNCGACNFKIAVDENTKKNPVQVWERTVYQKVGESYSEKYAAGQLRRIEDTSDLYYLIEGEYVLVDTSAVREGWLVQPVIIDDVITSRHRRFQNAVFSTDSVINGEVGSIKYKPHFAGDVLTNGKFIESQQDTSENYVWVALQKDVDSYGTIMPAARPDYGDHNFDVYIRPLSYQDVANGQSYSPTFDKEADKFVLTNIRLPQAYLRRAERDLSKRIIAYMYDNNYQKFNFSIKFSRIFLAQNADIDTNLNENSVLYVTFNNRTYRQYAKQYTYKMSKDAVLPEISVELNEELTVSRTYVEQQAAFTAQTNNNNRRRWRRDILGVEERISRRTIDRNADVVIGGNFISRGDGASFGDMRRLGYLQDNMTSDSQYEVEFNHFRRADFKFFENEFSIGDDIHFATPFKRNNRMIRRRWDDTAVAFIDDSSESFAPAFISGNKIVDYKDNAGTEEENNSITPVKTSEFDVSAFNTWSSSMHNTVLQIKNTVAAHGNCTTCGTDEFGRSVSWWYDTTGRQIVTDGVCYDLSIPEYVNPANQKS